MNKKIVSGILLLTFLTSLFSVNVFATELEVPENIEGEVEVVEELSEEEIKRMDAEASLMNYQMIFNKKYDDFGMLPNVSVVEVEIPEENQDPESEVIKTRKVLAFGEHDGLVYFTVEDLEFELWVESMAEDLSKDVIAGLDRLKEAKVTLDHIKLDKWGKFFNDYYGKTVTNFPIGDITLEYSGYKFVINNTKEAKTLFIEYIFPALIEVIEEEAQAYPAKRYALEIGSGCLLKDFTCDLSNVREIDTVYPFDGVETHIFYNLGSYYGMSLGKDYVDILRGYIEDGESGYNKRVEGPVPGCVNVLSYITLIKDVSGNTLNDKVLSDFMLYQNLAVRLDTKELINMEDMTTIEKKLYFGDYKLNPDNLIVAAISDGTVVIQPTYLECFFYNGYNKGLGRFLDITDFVLTGEPYFTYVVDNQKGTLPIEYFTDGNGILDTKLGGSPFLVYYNSHVPYDLMINWAYNQSTGHFADEKERDAFVDMIRTDMDNLGRSSDFNAYMKAAGQMTDTTKMIMKVGIAVVVILIVVVGIFVVKSMRRKNDNNTQNNGGFNNSSILFGNDDDDDDDDNDDGGFELK